MLHQTHCLYLGTLCFLGLGPSSPHCHQTELSPDIQPLVRPCFSTGCSALRTNVQAYSCYNRCLQNRLGGCVKWVCNLWLLDGTLTALAYQLPRVASSVVSFAPVLDVASGQARVGQHAQYCDMFICPRCMSHLACHLLWSQWRFKSLCVHIPSELNHGADALLQQLTFP